MLSVTEPASPGVDDVLDLIAVDYGIPVGIEFGRFETHFIPPD